MIDLSFVPPLVGTVAGIGIFGAFMNSCYKKAPPTEAIVVTGLGHKEPKVVSGKGVFVVPIIHRADRLSMRVLKLDVKTPDTGVKTSEGVPLWIDSVVTAQVYSPSSTITQEELNDCGYNSKEEYIRARQQAAISNFLGMKEDAINDKINDVLQGNLREIVAEMTVNEVLTKRKEFASRVLENARPDLAKIGLEIVTFNIQDIRDAIDSCGKQHGVVEAIGVQREMEVKKEAEIARANAERDIIIAKAKAKEEANARTVLSEKTIAEDANKLNLKKAELRAMEDKANVDAAAAGEIQKQVQLKVLKERTADAEIAEQEKKIIRAEKEAEVTRRKLNAEIREQADAKKYADNASAEAMRYEAEQKALAEKARRQAESDAKLYETTKASEAAKVAADANRYAAEQEAEGIRARGEAEAQAIRAKAIAEAEGIEKKAIAQAKMGEASKLEMMYNILPQVAHEIAGILSGVDNVTLYGTDTASQLMGATTQQLSQFMKSMQDGTGLKDFSPAALAGATIGASVGENIKK